MRIPHSWCGSSARRLCFFAIRKATSVCSTIAARTAARRLSYGRVEERGIACPYHGWLYDTKGNCLETPAEPCESKFHLTVKQTLLSGAKAGRSLLGVSGSAAGAADSQFRYLVQKGRLPKDLHPASARLQLVSGHGKFHGPGASADSSPGHRQARASRFRIARAG